VPVFLKIRVLLTDAVRMIEPPCRLRYGVFDGQEDPGQVDFKDPGPLLGGQLLDRRPDTVDPGVSEDDVEPSPAVADPPERRLHDVGPRDGGDDDPRLTAIALAPRDGLLQFRLGPPQGGDPGPLAGQQRGRRLTNPQAIPRHQRHALRQLHRRAPSALASGIIQARPIY
jgi:hypothetical protein